MTRDDAARRAANLTVAVLGGVVLAISGIHGVLRWARYQATR